MTDGPIYVTSNIELPAGAVIESAQFVFKHGPITRKCDVTSEIQNALRSYRIVHPSHVQLRIEVSDPCQPNHRRVHISSTP